MKTAATTATALDILVGGVTTEQIRAWRQERSDRGLPSGIADFWRVTGICRACRGRGCDVCVCGRRECQ